MISGQQQHQGHPDLRKTLYTKLVRLSFYFFDRHQTGQLMSRATVDLQSVRFFLGYGLIFFFQHSFTVLGVGVLLFIYSWQLSLIVLALSPAIIALAYRYSHVSHPVLRDVQQKMADVATVAEENVVGVHVVKAFAQEQAEQDKFEGPLGGALLKQSVYANRQRAFYVPLLYLGGGGQAAVLLVGGAMVVDKSMSSATSCLQPLAHDGRLPAAHARHVDRRGPARDRLGRAHLRDHGRARGDRRPPGRRRAAGGTIGGMRFEDVVLLSAGGRSSCGSTLALDVGHDGGA